MSSVVTPNELLIKSKNNNITWEGDSPLYSKFSILGIN